MRFGDYYSYADRICRCNWCDSWFMEEEIILTDDDGEEEICPHCYRAGFIEDYDLPTMPVSMDYIDPTMRYWEIRTYDSIFDLMNNIDQFRKDHYIVHFRFDEDEKHMYEGTIYEILDTIFKRGVRK